MTAVHGNAHRRTARSPRTRRRIRRPSVRRRSARPPWRGSQPDRARQRRSTAATAPSTSATRNPVTPSSISSLHRATGERDHGCAARHRLDDAVAEGLVETDQVEQCVGAAEELRTLLSAHGAEKRDVLAVEPRARRARRSSPDPGRSRRSRAASPRRRRRRSLPPFPCPDGSGRRRAGSRPAPRRARTRRCRSRDGSSPGSRAAGDGRRR